MSIRVSLHIQDKLLQHTLVMGTYYQLLAVLLVVCSNSVRGWWEKTWCSGVTPSHWVNKRPLWVGASSGLWIQCLTVYIVLINSLRKIYVIGMCTNMFLMYWCFSPNILYIHVLFFSSFFIFILGICCFVMYRKGPSKLVNLWPILFLIYNKKKCFQSVNQWV